VSSPPLAVEAFPAKGLSRRAALMVTVLLLLACGGVVVWLAERPLLTRPVSAGSERRAAFAIRDCVLPFQQWGTRSFTLPTLQSAYDHVDYMTMHDWRADVSEEFATRLGRLLENHDAVDLFLLAHTNPFVQWVAKVPADLRKKLRLVYNTGCFDLQQKEEWMQLGAHAYVGHVGSSESPVFYVYFLRRWLRGGPLRDVVAESNALTATFLGDAGFEGLLSNGHATVASTHAELTGDETLTIGTSLP